MTWKEFKTMVEKDGLKDDDFVTHIDCNDDCYPEIHRGKGEHSRLVHIWGGNLINVDCEPGDQENCKHEITESGNDYGIYPELKGKVICAVCLKILGELK